MDVELQILKHLPRNTQKTVELIDSYCSYYQKLFPEVRSYECFEYLHLGIISPKKRKSLPEIGKVVGINSQSLHHFLAKSPVLISESDRRGIRYISVKNCGIADNVKITED
jgi:SRSO17 transposase